MAVVSILAPLAKDSSTYHRLTVKTRLNSLVWHDAWLHVLVFLLLYPTIVSPPRRPSYAIRRMLRTYSPFYISSWLGLVRIHPRLRCHMIRLGSTSSVTAAQRTCSRQYTSSHLNPRWTPPRRCHPHLLRRRARLHRRLPRSRHLKHFSTLR